MKNPGYNVKVGDVVRVRYPGLPSGPGVVYRVSDKTVGVRLTAEVIVQGYIKPISWPEGLKLSVRRWGHTPRNGFDPLDDQS